MAIKAAWRLFCGLKRGTFVSLPDKNFHNWTPLWSGVSSTQRGRVCRGNAAPQRRVRQLFLAPRLGVFRLRLRRGQERLLAQCPLEAGESDCAIYRQTHAIAVFPENKHVVLFSQPGGTPVKLEGDFLLEMLQQQRYNNNSNDFPMLRFPNQKSEAELIDKLSHR